MPSVAMTVYLPSGSDGSLIENLPSAAELPAVLAAGLLFVVSPG